MSDERWVTASHAREFGMVRAHNGIGWFWTREGSDMEFACMDDTLAALERGDAPPPPVPE